ncbi:MAG: hypothetical protein A4E60_01687 [Syntrophorhabdus sp. PtaB.Bin047]|nr:MAG: hypothetical protein A4E60_01687 [Syntrophorhabdus sp. PtaB.Bin047]
MSEIKEILDYYWMETERIHRCRPAVNFPREGSLVKRLLLDHGADVNTLKAHIAQSIRAARKGETRLALMNVLISFQSGMQQQSIPPATPAIPFGKVIGYLNTKAGSSFKSTDPATMRMIEARWSEGYRLEDFQKVIDNMTAKWGKNAQMMDFLRPATLFSDKFGNYLGAKITPVDLGIMSRAGYESSLVLDEWIVQKRQELRARNQQVENEGTDIIPFTEIVTYLNQKAGSSYKPTDAATMRMIEARWMEGYRLEDFQKVVDNMTAKWGLDPKMMEFLRPATLFSDKFGNYLGAVVTPVDRGLLSRDGYRSSLVIKSWAERKRREMEEEGGEEGEEEVYA